MRSFEVWPQEVEFQEGSVVHRAVLEGRERCTLWFRAPVERRELLSARAEAFVAAALLHAMRLGAPVRVHAPLSPSFLRNLEELQTLWSCWDARLRRVEIEPESERESAAVAPERALALFSGGVDSCFTAWRHLTGSCGRRALPLRTALMLHGSEIAVAEPAMFARALERSRSILAGHPVELVPLATNFRHALPDEEYASRGFGALLAAALLLFQESHTTGLIPASFSYHGLVLPYASTPLNDPLFSTARFAIEHDGALASRAEKMRAILAWPAVLRNLRVCNLPDSADRNCGRCEKCIRNILTLRIAGVEDPPCFPGQLTDAQIRQVSLAGTDLEAMRRVLRAARAAGVRAPWVAALETGLRRNERRERWQPVRRALWRRLPRPLAPLGHSLDRRFLNS